MASVKQFQVTFDCAEPERVARFWCEVLGYSYRRHRRGLRPGTISIARCRLIIRVQRSHASTPQVWARDCSSSAFPKARSSIIGCILTCGSAPGSWVKRAWPTEAECARLVALGAVRVRLCLPMATTRRASSCRTSRATGSVSTSGGHDLPRHLTSPSSPHRWRGSGPGSTCSRRSESPAVIPLHRPPGCGPARWRRSTHSVASQVVGRHS